MCRVSGPVFLDALSHDFHVASSLLFPGDIVVSAQSREVLFDDASLGARNAAAIFRTERNTLITSEFHRVSQFVRSDPDDRDHSRSLFLIRGMIIPLM